MQLSRICTLATAAFALLLAGGSAAAYARTMQPEAAPAA